MKELSIFKSIQSHRRRHYKVQRHDDLIKTHAVREAIDIRSMCNNAVNVRGNL